MGVPVQEVLIVERSKVRVFGAWCGVGIYYDFYSPTHIYKVMPQYKSSTVKISVILVNGRTNLVPLDQTL